MIQAQLANVDDKLDLVLTAIQQDTGLQPSTRRQYTRAVTNAVEAGVDLSDPRELREYAATVGSSTRAFLSAAIGKLVDTQERAINNLADPRGENVVEREARMAQACRRLRTLREAVPAEKPKGQKAHTWLSQREVRKLMQACEVRRSGNPEVGILVLRDKVAIGLMVAAGLRRQEAVSLLFDDIKLQPVRGRMRTVLDVEGKGAKDRVVPISDQLANLLDRWRATVASGGRILRSLGRAKIVGTGLSSTAVYNLVQKRGELIGKPDLQPHDLRRTFAQLGFEAGVPITQISTLLGHASIETTQRYLNLALDLEITVSDFVAL
jgi:integrase